MKDKKYLKDIDLMRLISCIAILLYHLNILEGGYLAVCTFFVLSGYLSCTKAFKDENFKLRDYYKNRLFKIYIPLLLVVFLSLFFITINNDINWFNLKTETTSVLFGYNNFWQLDANLDYFARHVSSPFMHFWYISILFQFDLVFPLIFKPLKKLGDRVHKILPCLLTAFLSIGGIIYFYLFSLKGNMMATYYGTLPRVFSLLLGVFIAFVHMYYKPIIIKPFTKQVPNRLFFGLYMLILLSSFFLVSADSPCFAYAMIGVSLLSCRLIDYAYENKKTSLNIVDKIIKKISSFSYEVYLVQYPIIFLFQYIVLDEALKTGLIIVLTLLVAFIINWSLNIKKTNKPRLLKYIVLMILVTISMRGLYSYIIAKDHTEEMKALEQELIDNQKKLEEKQKEYAINQKQEEDEWNSILASLDDGEQKIAGMVNNISVIGIGDSVMLGATDKLYDTFKNGYFDASISRTAWVINDLLKDLKNRDLLGDPIVIHLGTNGDCSEQCKLEILNTCGNRKVFWVTVTNDLDVNVNAKLFELEKNHENVHIIDWNESSKGHPEYFYADGIHLTQTGQKAYAEAIYKTIYDVYLEEYREKKQAILDDHEKDQKTKISFYGNDLLTNAFSEIDTHFKNSKLTTFKDFKFDELKESIEKAKIDGTLHHKVVLLFDKTSELTLSDYQNIINICQDNEVYILCTDKDLKSSLASINKENVTIVDFYKELENHNDYLLVDKIHLSERGIKALGIVLKDAIKRD